jgi:hypothetical protein
MPEIKQATVEALKHFARPFESLDDCILRLASTAMATSTSAPRSNGNARSEEIGTRPASVVTFNPNTPPDLRHSKLIKAVFGGEDLPNPKWNDLVRRAHEIAFMNVEMDFEKLRLMTMANIVKGEKSNDGYTPVGEFGFSLQGVAANDALRIVLGIARKLNLPVDVIFDWRVKEGAAHPGETGRVSWKPANSVKPYWSSREFSQSDLGVWSVVQDAFEAHYMRNFASTWSPDRRGDMMLVMTSDNDRGLDTLYMRLPETENPYEGFTPIPNTRMPRNPIFLVGDQIGYDQFFKGA